MSVTREKSKLRLVLRIALTCGCLLWWGFIFGNSLRTGTQSSAQSSKIVGIVQKIAGWFAPDGWIANAEGKDYLRLHNFIRKAAHFIEFAVLGGLLCWCYFSYTFRKKWVFLPILGAILTPFLDEGLQTLVAGRAGSLADALIDCSGAIIGFAFALLVVVIIVKIVQKRRERRPK